jgi:hypothetical protein
MPIEIVRELSERAIATAKVETSIGVLMIMAEVLLDGRRLILHGLHLHGESVGVNELGIVGLRRMVHEVMEELDVDEIVIRGSVRTTGSGPGRAPRELRFARKIPPEKRTAHDQEPAGGSGAG